MKSTADILICTTTALCSSQVRTCNIKKNLKLHSNSYSYQLNAERRERERRDIERQIMKEKRESWCVLRSMASPSSRIVLQLPLSPLLGLTRFCGPPRLFGAEFQNAVPTRQWTVALKRLHTTTPIHLHHKVSFEICASAWFWTVLGYTVSSVCTCTVVSWFVWWEKVFQTFARTRTNHWPKHKVFLRHIFNAVCVEKML